MKNIILIISLTFLNAQSIFAQCPDSNIALTTQEEVDSFAIKYPTCSKVLYSITISDGDSIKNLSALQNITSIEGDLSIYSTKILTSLSGLEKLTSIAGNVTISQNEALVDLSGLDNLVSINGSFRITKNSALKNLSGLGGLFEIGIGGLSIYENPALTNLSGLENLYAISGELQIKDNEALSTLMGLKNLETIGSHFDIQNNKALTQFAGLSNLNSIGGRLSIADNAALANLSGLGSLNSIGDGLGIYNNDALTDLSGFQSLMSLVGSLYVKRNDVLTSLSGLDNIAPNWLEIEENTALTDISSMRNIQSLAGHARIVNNDVLTNLSGLENLKSIGRDLHIEDNAVLSDLSALKSLHSIDEHMYIKNNAGLTNLSGLESVDSIGGSLNIWNNSSLTNLSGLEGLRSVKRSLGIMNNSSLTDLSGLDNLGSINKLFINDNPMLNNCSIQFICNYVASGNSRQIESNAQGCTNDTEIIENCKNLTQVKSLLFYDINQNKIQDEGEPPFLDGEIILNPGNENIYQNKINGFGVYYTAPQNYTVSLNEASISEWSLTTDSNSYSFSLSEGDSETVTFGVYPKWFSSHIISSMGIPNFICYDTITYNVSTKNTGTTITEGTLWFKVDSLIKAIEIIDQPDTIIEPGQYGWFFENLFPSHISTKQIDLVIPGRSGEGHFYTFESFVEFTDQNGEQKSKIHTLQNRIWECSCIERLETTWCYDPDKDGLGDPSQTIVSCEQPTNFVSDCSDLIEPVGIVEESINALVRIYPNPSKGIFKIELGSAGFDKAWAGLYNAQGRQIAEQTVVKQRQQWLEYPDLANGVYYLKVRLDEKVLQKKLVVMK